MTSVEVPGAAGARVREDVHYDAAGNFLGARDAAGAATGGRHFFHNSENHLLTAVLPGRVVDYVYDPSGRRVLKETRGGSGRVFAHLLRIQNIICFGSTAPALRRRTPLPWGNAERYRG
jgi:YD repeat-containing protein